MKILILKGDRLLQALVKNKARSFFLGEGKRVPREDILTDCVFGGLRYLDPVNAACVARWMLGHLVPEGYAVNDMQLWPRQQNREPDAILLLSASDRPSLSLIVEAKWGANKLQADQLSDQWDLFGQVAEGEAHHVLLVQHRRHVEYVAFEGAHPKNRARRSLLTWEDIASRLAHRDTSAGSDEANRLAADIAAALRVSGQRPFIGWTTALPVISVLQPIFFEEPQWWDIDIPSIDPPTKLFNLRSVDV